MLRLPVWNRWADGPLSVLFDLERDLNRLVGPRWDPNWLFRDGDAWTPAMDVIENADEYRCQIELPGVSPNDVEVMVDGNTLTVSGEKRYEHENGEAANGHRIFERVYGRFTRSLRLPRTVDVANITAHYDQGVLTLVLPKTESGRARRIPIDVATEPKRLGKGSDA